MRISDWSSDVCSSDLSADAELSCCFCRRDARFDQFDGGMYLGHVERLTAGQLAFGARGGDPIPGSLGDQSPLEMGDRSEEHTSELQSLMSISYAVFCLKQKKKYANSTYTTQ